MAVSVYTNDNCAYHLDKLDKVVYLIDEDALKNIVIDNGDAYISGLTGTPILIECLSVTLSDDSQEFDERYRFKHTLSFSVKGYANHKRLHNKYYAIVKSYDGTYWLVNPLFPSKPTYTYTLDANNSVTNFTFETLSNHPTLRLMEFEELEDESVLECNYGHCVLKSLKLNNANFSTINNLGTIIVTNDGFKDIVFNKNSATLTETFDGVNISHKITFNIRFGDYKSSWHYNLLEFQQNKYAAIVETTCGKYFLTGFHFGLQPSFAVTANADLEMDYIEITLTDLHDNGYFLYEFDAVNVEVDETKDYIYTSEHNGYECVDENTAIYLLKEQIDALGNPTGNYECLDGYQSQFSNLSIIGSFNEREEFISPYCSGNICRLQTSFPSSFVFNTAACRTYHLLSDTDWSLSSSNQGITISPSNGVANEPYTIEICNTIAPSDTDVTATITASYCSTSRQYEVLITKGNACFTAGQTFDISANSQYVNVPTSCCVADVDGDVTNVSIQNNYFRVYVSQNNTGDYRIITLTVTFCDGTIGEVTINQSSTFVRWVKEGTACDGNKLCDVERKYTGSTASNINTWTSEIRLVNCVTSTACQSSNTRWIDSDETTCSGGRKYIVQIEQVTYDEGQTWVNTGNKRLGAEVEDPDGDCVGTEEYEDWRDEGTICDDTTKYVRQRLYVTSTPDNPFSWIATDVYRMTDRVVEENSADCGYIKGSDEWLCETWVLDEQGFICDDGTKYAREERWVRDCNDCQNCLEEWVHLGVYRINREIVLEENSEECGYDPQYEGWCSKYQDDGDYICDGYNKYQYLRKYVRDCVDCNDCSAEWIATNIYKFGELIELKSFDCQYIPTANYVDWRIVGTMCDGYNKHNRERKYISDDGNRWYETNIFRRGALIEENSADCGYKQRIQYEYNWVLTTYTTCVGYSKYYQYKKQRRISGTTDAWQDVIPTVLSYDGEGTMQPQLIEEHSRECGYDPSGEPIYKWVLLDSSLYYYCDDCETPTQYRWFTTGTGCTGYNKVEHQKRQYSTDGGSTWYDVSPEQTQDIIIEYSSSDCGADTGDTPTSDYKLQYINTSGATGQISCNNNMALESGETLSLKLTMASAFVGKCCSSIGASAFQSFIYLANIEMTNKITSIGSDAFTNCNSLTSVIVPNSVKTIASNAFLDCANLAYVDVGTGITSVGFGAFQSASLSYVAFRATTPPTLGGNVNRVFPFMDNEYFKIRVPYNLIDVYKTAWNLTDDKIESI